MTLNNSLSKVVNADLFKYPFSHILVENFLPLDFLAGLKDDIKKFEETKPTNIFESDFGSKREWKNFSEAGSNLSQWINFANSEKFIESLANKFEIISNGEKISPDLSFDGGGYVISPPGSFLGYHADFNFSSNVNEYRILNVLFYLNEEYSVSSGGQLHLLDSDSKTVEKIVNPAMNTMLAFLTDDISFHGVTKNRPNFHRRSFNFYYYSSKPLSENQSADPHKTLWLKTDEHHH